ncbi:DUF1489 family protein [Aurantiacibacter xanthus]|uniref:DUF1489 family protein n=1 Tax=Aurantiacibacter xanthus TaxID=1784712 RepID=A0A3A1P5B7_9SPHN|nr:DUF1489 domain-containing protein [Aurantiacibacter xanthus]RIV86082.1 DUF1489 family protein [Aurantiacibacter xanthus]
MPLHMTKIAYRAQSMRDLESWFAGPSPDRRLRTRYLPKRHEEMKGGSLYWIYDRAMVARSAILGFEERPDGHWDIVLENRLHMVHPKAKRAHQGWRYLADEDAPKDLVEGEVAGDVLPGKLVSELSKLGLV